MCEWEAKSILRLDATFAVIIQNLQLRIIF